MGAPLLAVHGLVKRFGGLDIVVNNDGVYPAGIPVAQVVQTEPPRHTPFARALCRPLGGVGNYRHVAVLKPDPASKPPEAAKPAIPGKPAAADKPAPKRHGPR